ncbi:L-histidine N(alpha)-methyltransferase [Actinoalloteichus hymeniacidonis]|uniref:Histidine N-alpha-methyltransferase n=1 Tax=Actinoalloteichus hymeniacidonis TaxID=340345 RepID=A0AAC9HPB0_9PSEU|nr:L-histidine N(alpha)-methyltransferase [Actinoalloteichus hymeniacidonis]AOS62977.1 dimethylhistidine N-methyltransferase [Actinoalloteichus hymeniacidonis]MBB5908988.1 L-histidine N-alpha-methyltransferase [Actinoalloteichus hymeniacidonis]
MNAARIDVHLDEAAAGRSLRAEAAAGLTAARRTLSSMWLYDARGSELFEAITRLPEYYPTRAERAALNRAAVDIAEIVEADTLIELGSGAAEKTRLLLDAMGKQGALRRFVPFDVSAAALRGSAADIAADYPDLEVHGIVGDFTRHLHTLPGGGRRLLAFLGGTIGNLLPAERAAFLAEARQALQPGEWLLLGTDLVKPEATLIAAYDDAQGVTAEFNRNVLRVLNRELAADFDPERFQHVAHWDAEAEWIEMRLRAKSASRVRIAALGLTVDFAEGEELRTEVSAKFRPETVTAELGAAGFRLHRQWTDPDGLFAVSLAEADR